MSKATEERTLQVALFFSYASRAGFCSRTPIGLEDYPMAIFVPLTVAILTKGTSRDRAKMCAVCGSLAVQRLGEG